MHDWTTPNAIALTLRWMSTLDRVAFSGNSKTDTCRAFTTWTMTDSQRPGPSSEEVELTPSTDETLHPANRGPTGTQLFLSCTWVCFSLHRAVFSLTSGGWSGGDGIQRCSSSRPGMAENMLPDILSGNTTHAGCTAELSLHKSVEC